MAAITGILAAAILWWSRRWRFRGAVWTVLGLFAIPWGLIVWAFLIEPESLVVRHVTIESGMWSGPPVKLGLISDTHAGAPHGQASRLRGIMRRMNKEKPDIVLLLGDYVGRDETKAQRAGPGLSPILKDVALFDMLKAPLGIVAVQGNHDVGYGWEHIEPVLTGRDITVLKNEALQVRRPGGDFWLAGVTSRANGGLWPEVAKTEALIPAGAPFILMMHEPDMFAQASSRPALTVAGHTHCGQVFLPIIGRPVYASHGSDLWPCHLYNVRGRQLYVTGGTGTSIIPVRFRAPPEITIVILKGPSVQPVLAPKGSSH